MKIFGVKFPSVGFCEESYVVKENYFLLLRLFCFTITSAARWTGILPIDFLLEIAPEPTRSGERQIFKRIPRLQIPTLLISREVCGSLESLLLAGNLSHATYDKIDL